MRRVNLVIWVLIYGWLPANGQVVSNDKGLMLSKFEADSIGTTVYLKRDEVNALFNLEKGMNSEFHFNDNAVLSITVEEKLIRDEFRTTLILGIKGLDGVKLYLGSFQKDSKRILTGRIFGLRSDLCYEIQEGNAGLIEMIKISKDKLLIE